MAVVFAVVVVNQTTTSHMSEINPLVIKYFYFFGLKIVVFTFV
jgi:hypothetical protein